MLGLGPGNSRANSYTSGYCKQSEDRLAANDRKELSPFKIYLLENDSADRPILIY